MRTVPHPALEAARRNASRRRSIASSFGGAEIAAALLELRRPSRRTSSPRCRRARERALAAAPAEVARQWQRNARYDANTVGRMMEPVIGAFAPERTVGETIEALREMVKSDLHHLRLGGRRARSASLGIVTMRDLLFSEQRHARSANVMLQDPFALHGGDAARGRDEAGARPPLSGLSGGRRRAAPARPGARPGDVRGAGDRDLAAGRQHGRRREGRAPRARRGCAA